MTVSDSYQLILTSRSLSFGEKFWRRSKSTPCPANVQYERASVRYQVAENDHIARALRHVVEIIPFPVPILVVPVIRLSAPPHSLSAAIGSVIGRAKDLPENPNRLP